VAIPHLQPVKDMDVVVAWVAAVVAVVEQVAEEDRDWEER